MPYKISKRQIDAISNGIFLIGLGILFYTRAWWPGILLVICAWLAFRQYFTGRLFDMSVTIAILAGFFIISYFHINWDILMPILFVLGGIYIILREYFYAEEHKETESNDDNHSPL
jgi:hypothetical protein